jgi:pimeloyl-ACP methyl ester carboxylesterase
MEPHAQQSKQAEWAFVIVYKKGLCKIEATVQEKRRMRKPLKLCLIMSGALAALIVLTFAVVRLIYPAIIRESHTIESPGIDLMELTEIGGIQQALYFRGEDTANPVILFLHGGPGSPEIPFLHAFQYEWEKDFTVVHWDQRNAGKTYYANDPDAVLPTLTAERVLEDAHEVTAYIKQKLNADKLIIMGHSWGSVLGTMLVQTYPEDYSAYIAVGQVVNMKDNERLGYETVVGAARAANNQADVAALEALAPYPPERYDEGFIEKILLLRQYQAKYKLASAMDLNTILPAAVSPYYSFSELMYFFTVDVLPSQGDLTRFLMDDYDARNYGTAYSVPVYYIMGENDYQTPYPLAKAFFEELSAPVKRFFSVPDAGHFTMLDNKEEFTRILLEEIRPTL